MMAHSHSWRQNAYFGPVGHLVCEACGDGILVPTHEVGWWGAPPAQAIEARSVETRSRLDGDSHESAAPYGDAS